MIHTAAFLVGVMIFVVSFWVPGWLGYLMAGVGGFIMSWFFLALSERDLVRRRRDDRPWRMS